MPKDKRIKETDMNKPFGYSLEVPIERRDELEEEDLYISLNVLFRTPAQFKVMRTKGFEILNFIIKRYLPPQYEITDEAYENAELTTKEKDHIHLDLTDTMTYVGDTKINKEYHDDTLFGWLIKNHISEEDIVKQNEKLDENYEPSSSEEEEENDVVDLDSEEEE